MEEAGTSALSLVSRAVSVGAKAECCAFTVHNTSIVDLDSAVLVL